MASASSISTTTPGWESRNCRPDGNQRRVLQDFGHSLTSNAGGAVGEIGGHITPAAEPAYYAKAIEPLTLRDRFTAAGSLACADGAFHVLLGFFNSESINEWRTPNSIALRLNGRGECFFAYLEYATSRWRAGGDSPRPFPMRSNEAAGTRTPAGFSTGRQVHRWSLSYDPEANNGQGAITATLDDQTSVCNLEPGHQADGATFNRFGLLNIVKSADGGGELWIDDVTINGRTEDFSADPCWEGHQNRREYETLNIRPRVDFGFSNTQFAQGLAPGELGGVVFRGDCRYPDSMAFCADRIGPLSLDRPIRARGKVVLKRGVSDSTVLFGFFHDQESMSSNPAQNCGLPRCFLGVSIEGPSRDGFYFAPACRLSDNAHYCGTNEKPPVIYPDGEPHEWSLEYEPAASEGRSRISVKLGDHSVRFDLTEAERASSTHFNRFGLVTTWIDGNAQVVYFDDLTYTASQ